MGGHKQSLGGARPPLSPPPRSDGTGYDKKTFPDFIIYDFEKYINSSQILNIISKLNSKKFPKSTDKFILFTFKFICF